MLLWGKSPTCLVTRSVRSKEFCERVKESSERLELSALKVSSVLLGNLAIHEGVGNGEGDDMGIS